MPRVTFAKRSKGGHKTYTCSACREEIVAGENYYKWSFRYGGTYYQHGKCGHPKPSQLTQSRMSEVYAAIEEAEEALDKITTFDRDDVTDEQYETECERVEGEITDILQQVADVANDVAQEYRDADEQFGGGGNTQSGERADELEGFVYALESFSGSDEMVDMVDEARSVLSEAP